MDIGKILLSAKKQNDGIWYDALHPVTGAKIDMRFKICGPDSKVQREERFKLEDFFNRKIKNAPAPITAGEKDAAIVKFLASVIIDWEVTENGNPLRFSEENKIKLINAGTWLRAQIDSFAGHTPPWETTEDEADLMKKAKELQDAMEGGEPDASIE